MAGFLSGLKELLLGYEHPALGAANTGQLSMPEPEDPMAVSPRDLAAPRRAQQVELQAAPTMKKEQGLLSQFGNYLISPEGRLAIGTTLRAGNGNENAFADQARVRAGWDANLKLDEARADAKAKNDAFQAANILDEATGRSKFDSAAYTRELQKRGYKGDMLAAQAEAKTLRDKVTPLQGPRGQVLVWDEGTQQVREVHKGGPEHTEFEPGKTYLIEAGAEPGIGAQATQPAAAAPTGAPATPAAAPAAPTGAKYTPQDREALAQMIATEALNQGEQGMAAAGAVALNRARTGYGGAKSVYDAVHAPHQFEGMGRAGQIRPQDMQKALAVADRILSGELADPTGGAINFINKDLQLSRGDAIPSWAQGEGQKIGAHTFFGGKPGAQELTGSSGGDTLPAAPAAPAGLPPAPPGYKWFTPGPAAAKENWVDLTPEEAHARGWTQGQRNTVTNELKGSGKEGGGGPGKLNAPQTKVVNESLFALGTASGINSRIDKTTTQLDNKLLTPSLVNSAGSWIAGQTGVSTPQQRAFNSFRSDLEKLRNDSLRLNKGVQTEGDAQRAWNEILTHLNDPEFVRQRLAEVKDYNQQAIELHKAMVTQNREDAGMSPIDFSKFEAQPLPERNTGAAKPKYEVGKVYATPKGNLRRTANGWVQP
jgi:hypothetical protein